MRCMQNASEANFPFSAAIVPEVEFKLFISTVKYLYFISEWGIKGQC